VGPFHSAEPAFDEVTGTCKLPVRELSFRQSYAESPLKTRNDRIFQGHPIRILAEYVAHLGLTTEDGRGFDIRAAKRDGSLLKDHAIPPYLSGTGDFEAPHHDIAGSGVSEAIRTSFGVRPATGAAELGIDPEQPQPLDDAAHQPGVAAEHTPIIGRQLAFRSGDAEGKIMAVQDGSPTGESADKLDPVPGARVDIESAA